MKRKNLSIQIGTAAYVLFILVCVLSYAIDYITNVIQVESFSQFLYTMKVGMGGASNTIVQILQGFLAHYLLWVVLATILYGWYLHTALHLRRCDKEGHTPEISDDRVVQLHSTAIISLVLAGSVLVMQVMTGYSALKIDNYLQEQQKLSSLYEKEYVAPVQTGVQAPAQKKNLIYIYLESMETTYASGRQGGGFGRSAIPELYELAKSGTDFSAPDDQKLNGGQVTNKTSWTAAGIVAQTSGTPLGISNAKSDRTFESEEAFLPNVTSLGDILEEAGYHNVFMCGSEASYAGRANYFRQHGKYEIFDVIKAREDGRIPPNYNEWWGFEDSKLISFAKEKLTSLAQSDQPFNFTMLTADTHFKDGYLCPDCPDTFDSQYKNVIRCSDHRIAEFIKWIQAQPFASDTVIVLAGDHLSMDGSINQEVGLDFGRRTFFAVVNGPAYTQGKTRSFTTLDVFPTTLEALGFQVEGHRLGLGTSLYSDVPTLCEKMGFDTLNEEISYRSLRFEEDICKGDGLPLNP